MGKTLELKRVSMKSRQTYMVILLFAIVFLLFACARDKQTTISTATPIPATKAPIQTVTSKPTQDLNAKVTAGVATYSAQKTRLADTQILTPSSTPFPTQMPTPTPLISADLSLKGLDYISQTNVARLKLLARFGLPVDTTPQNYWPWIVFSIDGSTLAYIDPSETTIKLLDVSTLKVIRTLQIEPPAGSATNDCGQCDVGIGPAFSPDGKRLATISCDGPQIWEIASGKMIVHSTVPVDAQGFADSRYDQEYTSIVFSPDGSQLLTGSTTANSGLTIWDAQTGGLLKKEPSENNGIGQLILSPDQRFVVSAERGGNVAFYHPVSGEPISYPIQSMCPDKDNCNLFQGYVCLNSVYAVAVTSNGRILAVECGPRDDFIEPDCDISLDRSDQPLQVSSYCSNVKLFSTQSWKWMLTFGSLQHKSGGISFNRDGGMIAFGVDQSGNRVELWSTLEGKKLSSLEGFPSAFREIQFSPDGRILLVETVDGAVQLWGIADS